MESNLTNNSKKINNTDCLYIVMPAYNEQDNILTVVTSWYKILDKFGGTGSKLVISDYGSTDDTHKILLSLAKKYPKLEILDAKVVQHGPKLMALYKYAIANGANYIFQTDSDDQTNPDEFQDFWNDRTNFTGIFGNRTNRGDGLSRQYVEKIISVILKSFFHVQIPDANAPFRLMNAKKLCKYINFIRDDYNIPNIIISVMFEYFNEKTSFKEISFKPRLKGKNTINVSKIIKIGFSSIADFNSFRKQFKETKSASSK